MCVPEIWSNLALSFAFSRPRKSAVPCCYTFPIAVVPPQAGEILEILVNTSQILRQAGKGGRPPCFPISSSPVFLLAFYTFNISHGIHALYQPD